MPTEARNRLVAKRRVNLRDLGHEQLGIQIPSECYLDVEPLRRVLEGDLDREDVDAELSVYEDGTAEFTLLTDGGRV